MAGRGGSHSPLPNSPVDWWLRQEDIAAALSRMTRSAINNPAALSFRQFAESRSNDLHALAALCKVRLGLRLTPEDAEAALGQVRVPLLFVVADKERAPAEVQRLSQTAPNAQLVILPGEDHFSALQAKRTSMRWRRS